MPPVRNSAVTRTPVRAGVTRDRIGEAALLILDSGSDESALTMRSLGRALGVQAPSLYAHVSGIDDVVDLVHERINTSIDLSVLDAPDPLAGLRRFGHLYREGYGKHPVATTMIVTLPINSGHALVVYEAVAACLVRAGVPTDRVMPLMALLDSIALGSAIEPFAEGFHAPSATYRPDYPTLAQALRHRRRRHIDDDGFAMGMDAFIDAVTSCAGAT